MWVIVYVCVCACVCVCQYHHIYSPRETVLNSLSSGFGHTILWIDTCKSKFTILPYQPSGNEGNQYQQQAHLDEGIPCCWFDQGEQSFGRTILRQD